MTTELLAMLGGGFSGFVFKLIGTMVQNQAAITEGLIKRQQASDDSLCNVSSISMFRNKRLFRL